ncbi:MAG: alanyl-tRNA editing protein [Candidatus Heimdallarchaeota archaeon]
MPSITHRLYWKQPYETKFAASVVNIESEAVVLDQTLFYPAGGGQASDLGFLNIHDEKEKIPVIGVEKDSNEVIWHKVSGNDVKRFRISDKVEGVIDWNRRYQLMRSHTSQHVLSAAILQIAGIQTRQAMIDFDGTKLVLEGKISEKDLIQALILSNEICTSSHPILSNILSPTEAKAQSLTLRNHQIPESKEIRIIEIENHDKMACGGTHVQDTLEIGPIFLLDRKPKIMTYAVGRESLQALTQGNLDLLAIARKLNVSPQKAVETVRNRLESHQRLQDQRNEAINAYLFCQSSFDGVRIGEIFHKKIDLAFSDRKTALQELGKPKDSQIISVIVENGVFLIFSNSKYAANELMAEFCSQTGSRGGGSAKQAQCLAEVADPHHVLVKILEELEGI